MKDIEFWRISFNDWEFVVNGVIRRTSRGIELLTESEAVKAFLRNCMETKEAITNPLVNVGQSVHLYAGDYEVTHIDEQSIVLSYSIKQEKSY